MSYASDHEIIEAFILALREAGIPPSDPGDIRISDGIRSYHIEGDKAREKNGRYRIFTNGVRPAAYYESMSLKHGVPKSTWAYRRDDEPLMSAEERELIMARAQAESEARRREEDRKSRIAAHVAGEKYMSGTPFDVENDGQMNGYIAAKKLTAAPLARLLNRTLIIPVYDEAGGIMSCQYIKADPSSPGKFIKKFEPGARTGGGFLILPVPAEPPKPGFIREFCDDWPNLVFLCEGYATGVTINEATRKPVCVAFSAHNLLKAAQMLKRRFPDCLIVGCPDWDFKTRGNPGMNAMYEVRDHIWMPVLRIPFGPDERGTDWNDYAAIHGLIMTRDALRKEFARNMEPPDTLYLRRRTLFPDLTDSGKPKKTLANLRSLLSFCNIGIRYNEITKDIEYDIPGADYRGDNLRNAADSHLMSLCVEYGMPETSWAHFAPAIASMHSYNPVREWILSKPWDGMSRISEMCCTLSVAPSYPADFRDLLVKKWLLSAVASAMMESGFRARGVLVLQGDQSIGKTSWFRNLLPVEHQVDWFGEGLALSPDDKDSVKIALSHWIVELGELGGTFKKADLNKLKAFLTSPADQIRLPYARSESIFLRRTVYGASVNDISFLVDETGNSRWWVLPVVGVHYNHGIDPQQLFREIYEQYYLTGKSWVLAPEAEIKLEFLNDSFRIQSSAQELIERKLDFNRPYSDWAYRSISEVLLQIGIKNPNRGDLVSAGTAIARISSNRERARLWPCYKKRVGSLHLYFLPKFMNSDLGISEAAAEGIVD